MRVARYLSSTALVLTAAAQGEASLAPRTDDVLVSTYTSGSRANPSIAATAGGQFIVVWQDTRPEVDGTHVVGRRFDQDGALVGTEFQVDGSGSAAARGPSIVSSGDGEFAVVWRSDPGNGERARLLAQRIGEDGAAVGTEFQVNTARTLDGDYYLSRPDTAPAAGLGSGFVVVWSSGIVEHGYDAYGPNTEVYSRKFLADGEALVQDFVVSAPDADVYTRAEIEPDVDTLADGSFAVAWAKGSFTNVGSAFVTVARQLYPSSQPTGSEYVVVGGQGGTGPKVAARNPAGFSVAWSTYHFVDYIPQFGGEVLARTFDPNLDPLSDPFRVSTRVLGFDPIGGALRPYAGVNGIAGATSSTGEFVVAWASGHSYESQYYGGSSDGDRSGIFARPLGRDDAPTGRERQVNAVGENDQKHPDLAFADADTLAIVWDAEDNDDFAPDHLYARVFDLITPACGDADEDGTTDATDALFALQAAVGSRSCAACLCDVNSSSALTAADALIVLRVSVGADSTLTCPACSAPAVSFALQSDATCYGAHVEISAEAVPSGALNGCTADPSLALLGCSAAFTSENGALTFDARGCFLDPASLFSCTVSENEAAAMAQASTTACGCGCQTTCPSASVLCAATDTEPTCAAPAALVSNVRRGVQVSYDFTSVSAAQETVTSSTTCETCCDFSDDATFTLESDVAISELVLRFASGRDPSCFEDVSCGFDPSIEGPSYEKFLDDGDTVEVCISDSDGFDGPGLLGQCSVSTGFITEGPAEVVRALGPDLKPLVPAPAVGVE